MNTRSKLLLASLLVSLGLVSFLVYRTGQERPFRAIDLPKEPLETTPVVGSVTKVGENSLEVLTVRNDSYLTFTVTVTPQTIIFDFTNNNTKASFTDIRVGDRVSVTPTEDREDTTREAAYIDIFQK